jgi:hypothetical protein
MLPFLNIWSIDMGFKFRTIAVVGCALGLTAGASMAFAEATPTTAPQSVVCLPVAEKMPDADVAKFLANPGKLLTDYPAGGVPMSNAVRTLAGSSDEALKAIMGLVKTANSGQKAQIAAGLAHVVSACNGLGTKQAQDYGLTIQTSVASAADTELASSFQQSQKDIATASVGGAPGTSVGGGATNDGSSQDGGDNGYKFTAEGTLDTSSGDYSIGNANTFSSAADNLSPN